MWVTFSLLLLGSVWQLALWARLRSLRRPGILSVLNALASAEEEVAAALERWPGRGGSMARAKTGIAGRSHGGEE